MTDEVSMRKAVAAVDAMRFEVKGFGIDVALIEPGLIKTQFASAAVGALATPSLLRRD